MLSYSIHKALATLLLTSLWPSILHSPGQSTPSRLMSTDTGAVLSATNLVHGLTNRYPLAFNMSTPPQSSPSRYLSNSLHTCSLSQFCTRLSFSRGNTTHPSHHCHLNLFHIWMKHVYDDWLSCIWGCVSQLACLVCRHCKDYVACRTCHVDVTFLFKCHEFHH